MVLGPISKHIPHCQARNQKCFKCDDMGHFSRVCPTRKSEVKKMEADAKNISEELYNVNLFRVVTDEMNTETDFDVGVIVNKSFSKVLADTGAKISVCSAAQARKWDILNRIVPSNVKVKPYKSFTITTDIYFNT